MRTKLAHRALHFLGATVLWFSLAASPAWGGPMTLQIDPPWMTSGVNTGSVGTTGITASVLNDRWGANGFVDDHPAYGSAGFGVLRLAGERGDFFTLNLGTGGRSETLTLTLDGPLEDPILFFSDLDMASTGWASFAACR